ncbi:gas vesicle protein GvpO, halophile-type [Halomarina halobia]|uniref:Gas vesicle protein GvpO, halophile-type n=1 Tax=Halomarina halobia TaxID=3033386 RepID=A0ABD6A5C2_9EURY|nr:gas vesicle protein GvpO [Halomarina sp. PSR21]
MNDQGEQTQCLALTADGTRCARSANSDGFCYQHGPDDPTVDADDRAEEPVVVADGNGEGDEEGGENDESEAEGEEGGSEESEQSEGDESGDGTRTADVAEVRDTIRSSAADLIGYPLDGIAAIERANGGEEWSVLVEVIERRSIPDTSDIIGEYRVDLSGGGEVQSYRRVRRFRRGDTDQEQF